MAKDPAVLIQAARTASQAIREGKKIFIYGCGATGRLAKQMESAIWRPFWKGMKKGRLWERLKTAIPGDIENRLIGEMTGGDRALISSLEGFEDLQLVGKLQMKEREVGDKGAKDKARKAQQQKAKLSPKEKRKLKKQKKSL